MPTTVYDVAIRYEVEDKASHGLEGMAKHAENAERHTMGLKEGLVALGEVFLVGEAFHKGKELFIDWNREIQNMRIQGAAMLQANDLAKTWDQATISAGKMVDEFNRFAVTSPVTTRELEGMANGVSTAVAQAGGGIKDIVNVTEQGIIAAKAFGMESSMAALQISEAISRGAHVRERFTATLIKTQNMTLEEFNKLDPTKRVALIEKALNSPAMKNAARAFGDSWDGVWSTLQDKVEITFGHAGHQMFMAIAGEVKAINVWLTDNDALVEQWGAKLGMYLKEGFSHVRSAVAFLVEHKDTLLKVGEVWAASKILGNMGAFSGAGIAGGAGGMGAFFGGAKMGLLGTPGQSANLSLGQVLGGAASSVFLSKYLGADKLQSTVTGLTGALSTLPGPLGLLGSALNGLVLAIEYAENELDKSHREQVEKTAEQGAIMSALKEAVKNDAFIDMALNGKNQMTREVGAAQADITLGKIVEEVHAAGAYTKDAQLDMVKMSQYLAGIGIQGETQSQYLKIAADAFKYFGAGSGATPEGLYNRLGIKYTDFDSEDGKRKVKKPTPINVTIQKIEVASEDPDRFAMGLSRSFRKLNQNPTAAVDALHGSL
jgi:hypothetical protein